MPTPSPSLKALLAGIIDFAGLFPPANLPLEAALKTYARIQDIDECWMLSRFILPAKQLTEAARLLDQIQPRFRLPLVILGQGGANWDPFFAGLDEDTRAIEVFRRQTGDQTTSQIYEARIPGEDLDFQIRADALVSQAVEQIQAEGMVPFFEAPFDENWQPRARRLIEALSVLDSSTAGFKLRTGGVTPEAFPTSEQVAWAIEAVQRAGIQLKCTAGLHHPIRHFNKSVGVRMHGFLNVFAGAALSIANDLDQQTLASILEDEDPASFAFAPDKLSWREYSIHTADLTRLRSTTLAGFGSCSFDEPLDDLRSLNLI